MRPIRWMAALFLGMSGILVGAVPASAVAVQDGTYSTQAAVDAELRVVVSGGQLSELRIVTPPSGCTAKSTILGVDRTPSASGDIEDVRFGTSFGEEFRFSGAFDSMGRFVGELRVTSAPDPSCEGRSYVVDARIANQPPVAPFTNRRAFQDQPLALATEVTDPEGDDFFPIKFTVEKGQGSISCDDDVRCLFRPADGFVGSALVTVVVTDTWGGRTSFVERMEFVSTTIVVLRPSGPTEIEQGESGVFTASGVNEAGDVFEVSDDTTWYSPVSTDRITGNEIRFFDVGPRRLTVTHVDGVAETLEVIVVPGVVRALSLAGPYLAEQGESATYQLSGKTDSAYDLGDVTDEVEVRSSDESDEADGATVTFGGTGRRILTFTHRDGASITQDVTVSAGDVETLQIQGARDVEQGETTELAAHGFNAHGFDLGDVIGDVELSSSVESDDVEAGAITFTEVGERTIRAEHVDGAIDEVTITVSQGSVADLDVTGVRPVEQGESIELSARGITVGGFDLGDVTGDVEVSSSVETDEVDDNQVTFAEAGERTLRIEHPDGAVE